MTGETIDLSKAKHGDEFNTKIGTAYYLSQLVNSTAHVIEHADGIIKLHGSSGVCLDDAKYNLIPPTPRKLMGWVNIYPVNEDDLWIFAYSTKEGADHGASSNRIACIDLSQFEEGHGLSNCQTRETK